MELKRLIAQNSKFDPNIHQAMSEIEDEKAEAGTVLQEIQAGYMIGRKIIKTSLGKCIKEKNF